MVIGVLALVVGTFYIYRIVGDIQATLPDLSKETKPPVASQVYDKDGNLIGTFFFEKRYFVKLDQISQEFKNTIISAEDERFYMHRGFDVRGLLRVVWYKMTRGGLMPGASTITQQVARSDLYLNQSERTVERKITEIFLAYQLERRYTKDEILEVYCNQVPFGSGAYGIEAAARVYFGKNAKDLDYAESAMLCGLLPAPSIHNPKVNPEIAKENQLNVLRKLHDNGYITEEQRQEMAERELDYKSYSEIQYRDNVNYFVDYVKIQMEKRFADDKDILVEGGLKIHTTIDMNFQKNAEMAVEEFVYFKENKEYGWNGAFVKGIKDDKGVVQPQCCIVSLNPKTGSIISMMGGRNYNDSEYNRAVARQRPGSSFKIFDYSAALDSGSATLGTVFMSDLFEVEGYTPGEWSTGLERYGPLLTRYALEKSSNMCALRAGLRPGLERVVYTANKMGITTTLEPFYSLTVGGTDVKPLDMASAYGTLATMGVYNEPYAIERVESSDGRVIYEHKLNPVRVLPEKVAWLLTRAFNHVHESHYHIDVDFDLAGKTGTSGDFIASWYCFYSPDIATATYVGVDDNKLAKKAISGPNWGATVAEPLAIKYYLLKCYKDPNCIIPPNHFPEKPEGITSATVCKLSGQLVTEYCPEKDRSTEYFLEGTVPTDYCTYHLEPKKLLPVVIGDDGAIYKPKEDWQWCPTVEREMTLREYNRLPIVDVETCPAVLENFCWTQEGGEGQCDTKNLRFIRGDDGKVVVDLSFNIADEFFGQVTEVTIFWEGVQAKQWKVGDYDYDREKMIELNDLRGTLAYRLEAHVDMPPEGSIPIQIIEVQLRGPGNFYKKLTYYAEIVKEYSTD
ncbi:MAG TPA: transglycosylase domain-containing protein [Caldisericia bacterium]|nr:transglycosylase domain-containing protein [Caldisericia bacterium]HPI83058.1 transglycosylase domain-containing protein [Caldisericia bacterium]HPQ92285.1 transglycosylase domain-containing protein [Caldisericia bacterium]